MKILKAKNPTKVSAIKAGITKHVKSSMGTENPRYKLWYCGITNDTTRRNAEHKSKRIEAIEHWKTFDAETLNDANIIERSMHEKDMINKPHKGGAIETSTWVYVFKISNPSKFGLGGVINKNYLSGILKDLGLD